MPEVEKFLSLAFGFTSMQAMHPFFHIEIKSDRLS
jgi:hypothetical protein